MLGVQYEDVSIFAMSDVINVMEYLGYRLDKFGTQADFLTYYAAPGTLKNNQLLEPSEMGQYIKVAAFI